ncbi:MAG: DUF58 domain-containing protein [Candidatus Dormibacteria bacterium]
MTWRGTLLASLPVGLIALGARWPGVLWPALMALLVVLVLIVMDGRRAPGPSVLKATRHQDLILSVVGANPVTLKIENSGRPVRALVRDEYPPEMESTHRLDCLWLPGVLGYTLTPLSRGERRFGRTVVRVAGPWGLAFRQSSLGGETSVHVDADISAVRAYEALARRGRLAELGVRAQRRTGEGTEFERVRDAVPDDPPRAINWRATARTGRLMAVELMPERAQPVVVCIDHGRLMGVGAGALTKLDHAINAALLLIHVVLRTGDRAGLLAFSDHVTVALAPQAGRAQNRRFLDAVRPLHAGETEADYDESLTYLSRWQKRRALVAIFTDVLDPDQGSALVRQCIRLRRHHLPLVITVRDPAIDDAAARAPTDPTAVYERAVASALLTDREDTLHILRRSGVETIDADARTLSPRIINRYLQLKLRGRL